MTSPGTRRPAILDALFGLAMLVSHRIWGRVTGCLLIAVPAVVAMVLAIPRVFDLGDLVLCLVMVIPRYLVLALPSLIAAFLVHEGGHYLALRGLGHKAGFTWRFPLDMRTVGHYSGLGGSDAPSLVIRGLAGFGANVVLLAALIGLAVGKGSPMLAYVAVWQGVSALAATAWSASGSKTDAATLRNALALEDAVELRVFKEGCQDTVVQLRLSVTERWETAVPYWVVIRGLVDPDIVTGSDYAIVFATAHEETMVVFPGRTHGTYHLRARGRTEGKEACCLTRCGSHICVSL
jgi:hypothetical protein